jgi:hypothetical protein
MGWIHDGIDDGEPHPGQYALGAGQRFEIGDSVSGMQRHDMMGAAQLARLRASLGQNLQQRYGVHQPATKNVPSQYRDSGQISINISKTIAVNSGSFTAWNNVSASGFSTVYTSFKPNRIVLTETVIATFVQSGTTQIIAAESATASDLMLVGAFSGSLNTFPNAPSDSTGIHGPAIAANAFGVGISWPTVNAGIPVTANFSILQTALFRAVPVSPFTLADLTSITVNIFFAMFGPQLR